MRDLRERAKTRPQAYCTKCKCKVEIKNPQEINMKNKRPAIRGICSNCGIMVFRIGKG